MPGQFFMLEAPGPSLAAALLRLSRAARASSASSSTSIGPGTEAIAAVEPGDEVAVFGPLGNGYRLEVEKPLLVGGGIGIAPLPYLAEQLGGTPRIVAGFRSRRPRGSGIASSRRIPKSSSIRGL